MTFTRVLLVAVVATLPACGDDPMGLGPGEVNVQDSFFSPTSVSPDLGGDVTWFWRGSLTHNVVFEDATGNSPTQTSGTHTRNFTGQQGNFRYRCTIHSTSFTAGMVGTVIAP